MHGAEIGVLRGVDGGDECGGCGRQLRRAIMGVERPLHYCACDDIVLKGWEGKGRGKGRRGKNRGREDRQKEICGREEQRERERGEKWEKDKQVNACVRACVREGEEVSKKTLQIFKSIPVPSIRDTTRCLGQSMRST